MYLCETRLEHHRERPREPPITTRGVVNGNNRNSCAKAVLILLLRVPRMHTYLNPPRHPALPFQSMSSVIIRDFEAGRVGTNHSEKRAGQSGRNASEDLTVRRLTLFASVHVLNYKIYTSDKAIREQIQEVWRSVRAPPQPGGAFFVRRGAGSAGSRLILDLTSFFALLKPISALNAWSHGRWALMRWDPHPGRL